MHLYPQSILANRQKVAFFLISSDICHCCKLASNMMTDHRGFFGDGFSTVQYRVLVNGNRRKLTNFVIFRDKWIIFKLKMRVLCGRHGFFTRMLRFLYLLIYPCKFCVSLESCLKIVSYAPAKTLYYSLEKVQTPTNKNQNLVWNKKVDKDTWKIPRQTCSLDFYQG